MENLPSFPSLTPDERIWRLDWFGECAYPGSARRYAQPCIKVSLSPLRCDPSDHAALFLPDSTDHQHTNEAWVPIAALPMLAIGYRPMDANFTPARTLKALKRFGYWPETSAA